METVLRLFLSGISLTLAIKLFLLQMKGYHLLSAAEHPGHPGHVVKCVWKSCESNSVDIYFKNFFSSL